jgi:hypothetical protein
MDGIENSSSSNSSTVACIRCQWNVSTELLPSNDWGGDSHGFMKYTIEMGSGVMIYMPSFIKTG